MTASQRVPVLMYHRLGRVPRNSTVPGHYVSAKAFDRQLKLMKQLGWASTSINSLNAQAPLEKKFVITFDDGYESFYGIGLPILKQHDASATVFLVSELVGGTNQWDEREGDVTEPLMTWETIKLAQQHGTIFGSHTASHCRLTQTPETEWHRELSDSKATIEKQLGSSCSYFCYPYGAMNGDVALAVKQAGYSAACSTKKGAWNPSTDPYSIPRLNIRSDTTTAIFVYKILRSLYFGR